MTTYLLIGVAALPLLGGSRVISYEVNIVWVDAGLLRGGCWIIRCRKIDAVDPRVGNRNRRSAFGIPNPSHLKYCVAGWHTSALGTGVIYELTPYNVLAVLAMLLEMQQRFACTRICTAAYYA